VLARSPRGLSPGKRARRSPPFSRRPPPAAPRPCCFGRTNRVVSGSGEPTQSGLHYARLRTWGRAGPFRAAHANHMPARQWRAAELTAGGRAGSGSAGTTALSDGSWTDVWISASRRGTAEDETSARCSRVVICRCAAVGLVLVGAQLFGPDS
jgi:hypothetical protein